MNAKVLIFKTEKLWIGCCRHTFVDAPDGRPSEKRPRKFQLITHIEISDKRAVKQVLKLGRSKLWALKLCSAKLALPTISRHMTLWWQSEMMQIGRLEKLFTQLEKVLARFRVDEPVWNRVPRSIYLLAIGQSHCELDGLNRRT